MDRTLAQREAKPKKWGLPVSGVHVWWGVPVGSCVTIVLC